MAAAFYTTQEMAPVDPATPLRIPAGLSTSPELGGLATIGSEQVQLPVQRLTAQEWQPILDRFDQFDRDRQFAEYLEQSRRANQAKAGVDAALAFQNMRAFGQTFEQGVAAGLTPEQSGARAALMNPGAFRGVSGGLTGYARVLESQQPADTTALGQVTELPGGLGSMVRTSRTGGQILKPAGVTPGQMLNAWTKKAESLRNALTIAPTAQVEELQRQLDEAESNVNRLLTGGGTPAKPAVAPTAPASAGGAALLETFDSKAAARAAGKQKGDRFILKGVGEVRFLK